MNQLIERIKTSDSDEIELIMQAVLVRYRELFPEWDVNVISLEKTMDRNAQLDQMIALIERLKDKNALLT